MTDHRAGQLVAEVTGANTAPPAWGVQVLAEVRKEGIPSEIYPDASKLKKQLEYASRKQIPFVALIGKDEIESGMVAIKDMNTGGQSLMGREEFISRLKNKS